jgi:cytidylate kinase
MPLITLTSNFGSGAQKIAKRVSEDLKIEFFDDRKLQEKALTMGISRKDIEGIDEKAPRLFDRLFTNKPEMYLDLLGSIVLDIASKGEGVIVGHGAQAFLKDFNCALHVMITASEEMRVKTLMQEQNIDEGAAKSLIPKIDKRAKEFVQYAFNRDWNDFSGYDLVINLGKIGADLAVKLIVELAKSNEIKACSLNALEEMERSALERRVEAAIIRNNIPSAFTHFIVDVLPGGKVHLRGWAFDHDERERAIIVVKNVRGVSDVTSDIFIRPAVSD